MLSFYGRKKSRPLSIEQNRILKDCLPKVLASKDVFNLSPLHLEIGFGMGDFLFDNALENPNICFVGCEPYINGIVSLLKKIEQHNLKNLYITTEPIQEFLSKIPQGSLNTVYILFPDPWPKKRHHKRRLIQKKFLKALAEKIVKEGELYIATDHPDYKLWIETEINEVKNFQTINKFKKPKAWIETKYEIKKKAGLPEYFCFKKT